MHCTILKLFSSHDVYACFELKEEWLDGKELEVYCHRKRDWCVGHIFQIQNSNEIYVVYDAGEIGKSRIKVLENINSSQMRPNAGDRNELNLNFKKVTCFNHLTYQIFLENWNKWQSRNFTFY